MSRQLLASESISRLLWRRNDSVFSTHPTNGHVRIQQEGSHLNYTTLPWRHRTTLLDMRAQTGRPFLKMYEIQ